jgi:hypothetical protein
VAAYLRLIECVLPRAKQLLKPLAGPAPLIAAGLSRNLGLISCPNTGLSIRGSPLYMMTGWLILVYVMDWAACRGEKSL